MPGIHGIGLSAPPFPGRPDTTTPQVRFSSDQASARIESAQDVLHDGPCHDAAATRQPVHAPDLTDSSWSERWPRFTPAALNAGVRAVFALPLHAGAVRHAGAVDLYRRTPGALHDTDRNAATAFTAAAAELLTLERLGLDWTSAFTHASLDQTILALAGGTLVTTGRGLTGDPGAALPLARWFDHDSLPMLRRQVHAVSAAHGLSGDDANRFVLAVHEAMINAIEHGGGLGQLLLWYRDDRLWCEIGDHGPGIGTTLRSACDPATRPRVGTQKRRPSGMKLIQQACTTMEITTDSTGTRLQLSFQLTHSAPG
ncbi:ATP-binding protein [Actinoplanes sp. NBC_00393]|uniref:ATP-binding protein n=1 Tax=Actinoplanes sp. NBC_00393 TaxID=2975953 RepID=UPI002E1B037C